MSLASFAFIGGMGAVQQVSRVSADVTPAATQTSGTSGTSSNNSSSGNTTSVGADSSNTTSNGTSAGTTSNGTSANTASNATPTVADTPANYQAQITQGQQDAYAGKASAASTLSGRAADYYTAAYNGAKAAMAAYNTATQSKGAGTQDYTYYGNTASKKDDNGNTHTPAQQNPADGSQQYGSTDDPNQGGANDPQSASSSALQYEQNLNNKLNNANNVSVKGNAANAALNIPTSSDSAITNARSAYSSDSNLGTAFDTGVNNPLAQYGLQDAESGKWRGVVAGNSTPQDWYLNTHTPADTTNAYDQAYRGAVAAMNAYFDNNNNYQGIKSVQQATTGSAYYQQGFNDVVSQAAQGIAYVLNGNQWASVLTGNNSTGFSGAGTVQSGVTTIRLANDIDLTGASNSETDPTVNARTGTLVIDGQNHLMDYHGMNYTVNNVTNLYVQNFQTIYGYNFYGPFRAAQGAIIHFSNLNYVGPQLLSSKTNDVYFTGNVNVLPPINTAATYTSPFQSNVVVQGGGNQENLEVANFVLQAGAHYFGATAYAQGGTNIYVTGNLTMDTGSKMTLVPRGNNTGSSVYDGSDYGIWLDGGSLNIKKDATLNVIPAMFQGSSQAFGGAVAITDGQTANINIDGGTLNFEGYNGVVGIYNQPIDFKGTANINVINGGLLQVLSTNIPANNSNSKSFSGFINNNKSNANFSIGSKGSLNVGIIGSDSNKSTLYYGPININSVGGNHVIFTKPAGATYFQDAGNGINAFSVALTQQGQTTPTYFYNFNLPAKSLTYTATDFYGNTVTGTISGNVLDLANVPAVQVVGPLTKTTNADGSTKVTANIKVSNYNQVPGQKIFVGVGSNSGTATDYSGLQQVTGQNLSSVDANGNPTADQNVYTTSVSLPDGYSGGLLQVSYDLPKGSSTDSVGMRFHNGVNSVNTILTPAGYKTTVEAYSASGNKKVSRDTTGNVVSANGSTGLIAKGLQDATADIQNQNTAAHDAESFNTKTDTGYQASYQSAKAGYQAFVNNPGQDYTKTDAYQNSNSPDALKQGYDQAAAAAALSDAQKNVTNQAAYNNTADTAYKQAHDDYTNGYTNAIQNPGSTAPAGSSAAKQQGYSDAKGVATFFADEQAGTIKGSNYTNLNSSQQTAYNDAYTGYQQAASVKPTADNPDTNPSLAETAGFDYGQSLINGGYSQTRPTATASHMNNLTAAQIGYDTAQAAIKTANANYPSSSAEVQATDPSKLSTDSGTTGVRDVTFNQYVKFGAYRALKQQSDNGLNQYEEVGYTPAATTASYQAGLQAYQANPSATTPTPTGISAQSDAGKAAFANGYQAAQDAAEQGVKTLRVVHPM